jgi:hypothetical protein
MNIKQVFVGVRAIDKLTADGLFYIMVWRTIAFVIMSLILGEMVTDQYDAKQKIETQSKVRTEFIDMIKNTKDYKDGKISPSQLMEMYQELNSKH